MRILYVIANLAPRTGGPAQACLQMARMMARLGQTVSIFTTNQDGPTVLPVPTGVPVRQENVEIRYFPIESPRFWGFSGPLARALAQEIGNFDIVEIQSLYLFHNLVAGHFCRQRKVPYLIRPHGILDPFIRQRHRFRKKILELAYENRNLRGAAAIRFTAEEERELARPFIFHTPGVVVPLPLEKAETYREFPKGKFREKYPALADKRLILFFGRISFKKGLDILVEAFRDVGRQIPQSHLVIAGPDEEGYRSRVEGWVRNAGLQNRVTFTGMLTGDDKLSVLADADLFVLPSKQENFGIALVEAMAAGLPVVISDRVNLHREVSRAGAGVVVPVDSRSVATALLTVLQDRDAAAVLGKKGIELVRAKYDFNKVGHELLECYRTITGNLPGEELRKIASP